MSLIGKKVTPGTPLYAPNPTNTLKPGSGTHLSNGLIYASVAGVVNVVAGESITVASKKHASLLNQVIHVGQIVLGRVTRVTSNQATLDIISVNDIMLVDFNVGIVRKEDIKVTTTESVVVYDCFRVGDIVKTRVISLGDSKYYYLSTAEEELGVVRASCASTGVVMKPLSFKEMECGKSGGRELRKCAKPKEVGGEGGEMDMNMDMVLS